MRAVLFASATATTSGGRRRRSPITHGSALVAFDRSRFALAPLMSSWRGRAYFNRGKGQLRTFAIITTDPNELVIFVPSNYLRRARRGADPGELMQPLPVTAGRRRRTMR